MVLQRKSWLGFLFLITLLHSCGGGGGGSGAVDSTEDPPDEPPPQEEVEIMTSANRDSGAAPLGIFFDATDSNSGVTQPSLVSGLRDYTNFSYLWDFGDSASGNWTSTGRSKNEGRGYLAAHVYETPGTYTVQLTVIRSNGLEYNYTQEIVVEDPDVVFANNSANSAERTIYASTSGNDSNNGSFNQPIQTWAEGIDRLLASNGPRRLLLKRGETFTTTGANADDFTGPFHIGAYGSGADPVIYNTTASPFFAPDDGEDLTIANLSFLSTYNPNTGYGPVPDVLRMIGTNSKITIFQNSFSNCALNIHMGQLGQCQETIIAENTITAWQNYGILISDLSKLAILGNSIRQAANASTGDGKSPTPAEPDLPDHGPIRLGLVEKALVSNNDLFSNTGWSPGPVGYAHQPCLRIGSSGTAELSIVSDNLMQGGLNIGASVPASTTVEATIGRVIWERNQMLATDATRNFFDIALGGAVLRNNIMIRPSSVPTISNAISFSDHPLVSTVNDLLPNQILGNTYVSLITGAESGDFIQIDDNSMLNFSFKNNLVDVPFGTGTGGALLNIQYLSVDLDSDHNLYHATGGAFTTRSSTNYTLSAWQTFSGGDANSLTSAPQMIDPVGYDFQLGTNSPAKDAGVPDPVLFDDYEGSDRPTDQVNIGAYE